MSNGKSLSGKCFCGAVEIAVDGEPMAMGYCHCDSCREWSAGPVNAFSLWPPEAVHVTRGADKIGSYQKTEKSVRKWCTVCGGHLLTEHPPWGVTDVYAAVLPDLEFQPAVHVNYETTVLHLRTDLYGPNPPGRVAEAEGFSGRDGRIGDAAPRLTAAVTSPAGSAAKSAGPYNRPWARYGHSSVASGR